MPVHAFHASVHVTSHAHLQGWSLMQNDKVPLHDSAPVAAVKEAYQQSGSLFEPFFETEETSESEDLSPDQQTADHWFSWSALRASWRPPFWQSPQKDMPEAKVFVGYSNTRKLFV